VKQKLFALSHFLLFMCISFYVIEIFFASSWRSFYFLWVSKFSEVPPPVILSALFFIFVCLLLAKFGGCSKRILIFSIFFYTLGAALNDAYRPVERILFMEPDRLKIAKMTLEIAIFVSFRLAFAALALATTKVLWVFLNKDEPT
jgi:hypothetical protein